MPPLAQTIIGLLIMNEDPTATNELTGALCCRDQCGTGTRHIVGKMVNDRFAPLRLTSNILTAPRTFADPMSAVDLGGSNSRLIALKNGEVDVAGSFVRSRQDPKAWPKWSQVHQPTKTEGRAEGRRAPRRAAEASVIVSGKATGSSASDRSTDNAEALQHANSSPECGRESATRAGEHAPTAESPEYAE